MSVLSEGDLRISVPPEAVSGRRFDGKGHGLSHCMKAVDFVIEFADRYLFLEIKDPDGSPSPRARAEFLRNLESGSLDEDLKYKYRDSFLYEWAAGRADKPVDYFVLIASRNLDSAQLLRRRDTLRKKLPAGLPFPSPWKRPILRACGVFNIASWNRRFPGLRAERASAKPSGRT